MNTAEMIQNRVEEMCTHILFDYNGKACGIDPFSRSEIDIWYGDKGYTAKNITEVMTYPLFDGKPLVEIAEDIEDLEL